MTSKQSPRRPRTHACIDCPTMITRKATRCKPCHGRFAGAHPEYAQIRRAANIRRYTDPVLLAQQREQMRRAVEARVRKSLGWCPPEYLAEYRRLSRFYTAGRRLTAGEAKAIVLQRIKTDLDSLSPFERQERALRKGASLQDNTPITLNSAASIELRQKLA